MTGTLSFFINYVLSWYHTSIFSKLKVLHSFDKICYEKYVKFLISFNEWDYNYVIINYVVLFAL